MKENLNSKVEKANQIYAGLKELLEKEYMDMIVAIEVDSGDYFIGKTSIEACEKARGKYSNKIFVCKRIGALATYFVGAI